MHEVVEVLNLENIITYSKKVFRLGSLPLEEVNNFISDRSWIGSCCSHTMKRFHRCGKAFVKEKHTLDLACYAFS